MDFNWMYRSIFYLTLKLRREWFLPYLRELEATQYLTRTELEKMQKDRLNSLLEFAVEHVEYYKAGFPSRVSSLSEVSGLPLLEKDAIRTNGKVFMSEGGLHQRLKTSGGSTGAPVTLLKDSRGMARELAATWRGYGWAGAKIGDRQARFWGVPRGTKDRLRAQLIDFVCNRVRVTAFGYDKAHFAASLSRLEKRKPSYLYGYVSIIRELANYILENEIRVDLSLSSVITTAEVLTDVDRKIISEAFGTKVFNEYGCGEIGTIAHECEHGSMHINSENVLVEILDKEGKPAPDGQSGEIVVTDLTNFSMPMLRYRLKDWGTISSEQCACGRGLPVLEKVYGRQYDSLINKAKKSFHGEFFLYIVEDAKKVDLTVSGVQFNQSADLSILIKLCCDDKSYPRLCEFITSRLKRDFDSDLPISYEQVDAIARETSGKLRVVRREVA